jgi:hypothetical protein
VARTLKLPDALDGAKLSWSLQDGVAVRAGEPLATFDLDGQQVTLPADADGVLWRVLPRRAQGCGAGAPIAILAARGEQVGWDPALVQCVRVMLLRKCDECGNDYPVNGMVESVRCTRCGDDQRAPRAFWSAYLAEEVARAREPGAVAGGNVLAGGHGACTRQLWGIPPLCRKCATLLEWSAVLEAWNRAASGASTTVACQGCGELHRARLPPPLAAGVFPGIGLLLAETATVAAAGAEPAKPVVFKCPSCMASLQIDGVRRIVRCTFCESDVYLPDDLWLHFNPATRRGRWWMLFRP